MLLNKFFNTTNFAPQLKCNPLVVPAVISAGAGVVQGLTSYFSNKAQNSANIQMQRETNALNYKMFQEQNQFNKEQIEAQNLYNTPLNQFKRYEQAGLNPYLMMSGGAQSIQSQAAQAGQPNPAISPHVDYGGMSQGINSAISNIATIYNQINQSEAIRADAEGKKIDNVTRMYENWARINKLRADEGLSWAQKGYLNLQSQYYESAIPFMLEGLDLSNEQTQQQTYLYKTQAMKYINDMRVDNIQASLNIRLSKHTIQKIDSETSLNYQRCSESIQNIAESKSRESLNYSEIDLNGAEYQNIIADTAKKNAETISEGLRGQGYAVDNEKKKAIFQVEYMTLVAKLRTELKNGLADPLDIVKLLSPTHWKFGDNNIRYIGGDDDPFEIKRFGIGANSNWLNSGKGGIR